MSNPIGEQDLVGNFVTCSDLLNVSTTSNPAALGSGLAAAGAYVPGAVTFSSNATSNTYQTNVCEDLLLLVSLTSGQASAISVNTGSTTTNMTAAATLTNVTGTQMYAVLVQMPSAAIGSTTPPPGYPTAQYFNVSLASPVCEIANLAVFALGKLATGADFVNVRAGMNAVASGVVNSSDTLNPPTNLIGSGVFPINSSQ